jgi:hypothetical protein
MARRADVFESDVYGATLEIGGLVNAKLRQLGVPPADAKVASENVRQAITRAVKLATYFGNLGRIPRRAGGPPTPEPPESDRS